MRQLRFISPQAESVSAVYHCVSRVVDRDFKLGRTEKDVFVRMMREYEAFCGVQVLSFCIMSNHFHVLVEVPPKRKGAAVAMDDEVLLAKLKGLYSEAYFLGLKQMLEQFRATGSDKAAEELKAKYTRRMYDLSEFLKGLKQRFTQWYNGHHGRRGTLWEGRFKSVLVESGYAARVMAAYIDLNPIRAGMVKRPEDYKWCSYGEAMLSDAKKNRLAREGLSRVLWKNAEPGNQLDEPLEWNDGVADWYRTMLYADGEEVFVDVREKGETGQRVRKGFKRKDVEKVLERGGKLTLGETLRCKVRYFTDGMTVGSRKYVDGIFDGSRERFGAKRKDGARPMREVGWQAKENKLFTMRQLCKDALE